MFIIFVNDFAICTKNTGLGVNIENSKLVVLLYADDIVLIAPNVDELQLLLNNLYQWCSKWRLQVNVNKTCIFIKLVITGMNMNSILL